MKKYLALLLAILMVLSFAACGETKDEPKDENETKTETKEDKPAEDEKKPVDDDPVVVDDPSVKGEGVMTYAEYIAAEMDADVVIEGYVQGKQSWWNDHAKLYLQDKDGAYFVYEASCTEEEYNKLTLGTKIKVTGKKATWMGEIEVGEGATFVIEEGNYIADVFDATALLGNDEELIKHQNEKVAFKGLTVAAKTDADGNVLPFFYGDNNSGEEGSDADLYFDATLDGKTYTFCVEYYLCNADTDVYKAVQALKVGDKIDVEGFLYWYGTQSTQVTGIKTVA